MSRGGRKNQISTPVPPQRYRDPPFAFTIGARGNPHTVIRGEKLITKIPVLTPIEADIRVKQAASFLEGCGFPIKERQNLRDALIPHVNEDLALAGDSVQRTILIDQCDRQGGNRRKSYNTQDEQLAEC